MEEILTLLTEVEILAKFHLKFHSILLTENGHFNGLGSEELSHLETTIHVLIIPFLEDQLELR